MKQLLHKIISSFLSLILVFSTLSFAVEKHECGGKITDVSLYSDAEKCSSDMESCEIALPKTLSFNKKICCKDFSEIIQSSIVVEKTTKTVEIQTLHIPASFVNYINLFDGLSQNIIPFKTYLPPKIIFDIPVLHQTFLI